MIMGRGNGEEEKEKGEGGERERKTKVKLEARTFSFFARQTPARKTDDAHGEDPLAPRLTSPPIETTMRRRWIGGWGPPRI